MKKVKKRVKYWLPPVLWAGVIFWFSTFPQMRTTEIYWQDFILKKTAHFMEYGILAMLLYRSFINGRVNKKRSLVYSFILTVLYAVSDEIHQLYTPGRDARVRDVLIDSAGALTVLYWIKQVLPKANDKIKYYAGKLEII